MLTTEFINHILSTIPHRTVGLLGDLFLDRYLDIDPTLDEPSIETGLTAYQVTRVRSQPGALGTVINNLVALGVGHVYPIAVIGDDGEGYELRQAMAKMPGVDPGGVVVSADRRTPTYCKPMRGGIELNRLDTKNRTPTPAALEDAVIERLNWAWRSVDALIVLDQVSEEDSGVVTKRVRTRLSQLAWREPEKFVLADSRERIGLFRNVCVKPNMEETLSAMTRDRHLKQLEVRGLRNRIGRIVFCTWGPNGILVSQPEDGPEYPELIPAYPVSGPIDIVGAGDSCSAGIACAMVSGATPEQAAAFGNLVASITIQQIGTTGTATPEQVRQRWKAVMTNDE